MTKIFARILVCTFLSLLFACQSGSSQNALEPKAFQEKMEKDSTAALLDVRTPAEYAEGHLRNSKNIDFNNASFKSTIAALDTSKTYYVYCKSGGRSERAAEFMRKSGFKDVYELKGGILNWQEKGMTVEK